MLPKLLLLSTSLACASLCAAQKVVNATGATMTSATLSIEYSVGEIAISTISVAQGSVTQGLLQPNAAAANRSPQADADPPKKYTLQATPNPCADELSVVTDFQGEATLRLFAMNGRLVREMALGTDAMPMSDLPPAIYFLQLKPKDGFAQTVKVVKQ